MRLIHFGETYQLLLAASKVLISRQLQEVYRKHTVKQPRLVGIILQLPRTVIEKRVLILL